MLTFAVVSKMNLSDLILGWIKTLSYILLLLFCFVFYFVIISLFFFLLALFGKWNFQYYGECIVESRFPRMMSSLENVQHFTTKYNVHCR